MMGTGTWVCLFRVTVSQAHSVQKLQSDFPHFIAKCVFWEGMYLFCFVLRKNSIRRVGKGNKSKVLLFVLLFFFFFETGSL
ncbi:rCG57781 [Rattus norvegicus]|uniref:RCG57781 n=1 Tax=Rattus norvegicus TaxID=10116 RepID=A6JHD5_RAT|nr:rCG57781 [Rattus norvegicus]